MINFIKNLFRNDDRLIISVVTDKSKLESLKSTFEIQQSNLEEKLETKKLEIEKIVAIIGLF